MKKKTFKRILAVTLSLALLISGVLFAMPHTLAADSIEFVMDGEKRVGIKEITINGVTYYDINGGVSTIDPSEVTPIEIYKKLIVAEHDGVSLAKSWANMASLIFEAAGDQFGYNNNEGFSSNFDSYLTDNGDSSLDMNLVEVLAEENAWSSDKAHSTGWNTTSTLKAVQDRMLDEICDPITSTSGNDNGISKSACIEYCTGSSDGFALLNNTDNRTVLYNIATTYDYSSGSNKAAFSSFGLILYDFEVIPLADDDLAFITAAEGYEDLDAAEADNAPGVKYNTSGGTPNTSYISNPSASDTTVSAAYSETSSTTVSNYMESTDTYTFGQSLEVSSEFGVSFPLVADGKMQITAGITTEQAISTAYGTEESITKEVTTETVAEVNLPAHTQIGISQQSGQTEVVLDYDCPVYFNYKVAIFGMNGEFYADSAATESWKTAAYDQGGICIGFGTDTTTGGIFALDNLYNRAIKFKDMDGFEAAYGNCDGYYEKHDDGNASKRFTAIPWDKILDEKQNNGLDLTGKENVFYLRNTKPLSSSGATMTFMSTSMNTDITGIVPLYNLDYVQLAGDGVYNIAPGGTVDFGKIGTEGFNKHNVPYYGYVSDGGEWVLCDADGTEIDSVDGGSLDDVSNYQVFTGTKTGTYYAKFLIDETLYDKVDANGKIKNANLSSTPMVRINVTETGLGHICTEGPWQTTLAATCTTEGEQVANCITCGRVMYSQKVAKLDHIPVTITTPSTCAAEGSVQKICGACLGFISSESITKLAHTPVTITTPATCAAEGSVEEVCSACNTLLSHDIIKKTDHDEGVWKLDYEATADHKGQMTLYCSTCGFALESKEFELHEHEEGYEKVLTAPTCTANGEKGIFCSTCNAIYATEQIEKTGHDEGVWKLDYEATADHKGQMTRYCSTCDFALESKEFELHEHEEGYEKVLTAPTCTANGEKGIFCSTCNVMYATEQIEKTGHGEEFVVVSVKPTCQLPGENKIYCSDCQMLIGTETVARLDHVPGKWEITKPANCNETGLKQQACSDCGMLLGEPVVIDKLNHVPGKWEITKNATCTETGLKQQACANCDALLGEAVVIEKLDHIPGKWEITKDATCTQSGLMQQACTGCGMLLGDPVVIEPHEHQPGGWVTIHEAGCETEGEKIVMCTVCKGTLDSETIPAHGHSYSEWYKNNNSTHSRVCSICHDKETNNCKYTSTVTPSTCTEIGYTTHVCDVCTFSYVDSYTEALGHDWSDWKDDENGETHTRECQRENCDETETFAHNWSEWVYNEDGSLFCNGTKTRVCHDCGASETAEAHHTSWICQVFYPVIVFFGNIVHKLIYVLSLNWFFPELTIVPTI